MGSLVISAESRRGFPVLGLCSHASADPPMFLEELLDDFGVAEGLRLFFLTFTVVVLRSPFFGSNAPEEVDRGVVAGGVIAGKKTFDPLGFLIDR